MALRKYKTTEEAELDLICVKPDSAYFKRIAKLLHTGAGSSFRKFPGGLIKYKTMQEADEEAERWLLEAAVEMRRVRRQRNHARAAESARDIQT